VSWVQNRVYRVAADGRLSLIAGSGTPGFSGDGSFATAAQLSWPRGVAADSAGNIFIADSRNHRIREVTLAGMISTVAGDGTEGFSCDGGPATTAQLSDPYGVTVDSMGNLFIADTGNQRIRKVTQAGCSDIFLPQVAAGGGYTTLFTVTNTGAVTASEDLILTDQHGSPLDVSGTLTDSSGNVFPSSVGSVFTLAIPSGGTVFLSAVGVNPTSPVEVGWARLSNAGSLLNAAATYEYMVGTVIQTMVSVIQSQPFQSVTIPVDNSRSQGKRSAYAIANPTGQTVSVKLTLVGQDGAVLDDSVTIQLGPGEQIARYLWQDLAASADFRGSVVLQAEDSATFLVVASLEKQGILTAIPVITGKTPGVPD
jgi:hypothetical protein